MYREHYAQCPADRNEGTCNCEEIEAAHLAMVAAREKGEVVAKYLTAPDAWGAAHREAADNPIQGPALKWDAEGLKIMDAKHPLGRWLITWEEIDDKRSKVR